MSTPSESQDQTDDAYFEALAGRAKGGDGAVALRTALLNEQAAEHAPGAPVSGAEQRRDAAILAQLRSEGIFFTAQAAVRSNQTWPGFGAWLKRALRWLDPLAWPQRTALAAGVAFMALTLVYRPWEPALDEPQILRGRAHASFSVEVQQPALFARQLEEELKTLGVQPLVVQINEMQWSMTVPPPDSKNEAALAAVLQRYGFKDAKQAPYELTIRQTR